MSDYLGDGQQINPQGIIDTVNAINANSNVGSPEVAVQAAPSAPKISPVIVLGILIVAYLYSKGKIKL